MYYRKTYESPLGTIYMESDGEYLTGLWFKDSHDMSKHTKNAGDGSLKIFEDTKNWLDSYFKGINPDFIPKYKIENLTPFRKMVIDIINEIPYGSVITYNEIKKEIMRRKKIDKMSAQAVGGAVGFNPICIIIPCHRVIGENRNLTGYGGGIKNKIGLLNLEKYDTSNLKIPKKGGKL